MNTPEISSEIKQALISYVGRENTSSVRKKLPEK